MCACGCMMGLMLVIFSTEWNNTSYDLNVTRLTGFKLVADLLNPEYYSKCADSKTTSESLFCFLIHCIIIKYMDPGKQLQSIEV